MQRFYVFLMAWMFLVVSASSRADEIVKFDRQTLGFDIDIWLTVMRGQTLVMLGRGEEARPFLDRIIQLESSQVDAINYGIPSWAYVDLAWAEENIGLAQQHADRAFSIAMKAGNPYLRVYAQACRGVSHWHAHQHLVARGPMAAGGLEHGSDAA